MHVFSLLAHHKTSTHIKSLPIVWLRFWLQKNKTYLLSKCDITISSQIKWKVKLEKADRWTKELAQVEKHKMISLISRGITWEWDVKMRFKAIHSENLCGGNMLMMENRIISHTEVPLSSATKSSTYVNHGFDKTPIQNLFITSGENNHFGPIDLFV